MSHFDYRISQHLDAQDLPFYAIIMAAMRRADKDNGQKLSAAFPEVWDELHFRYNAPGGYTKDEAAQLLADDPNDPTNRAIAELWEIPLPELQPKEIAP